MLGLGPAISFDFGTQWNNHLPVAETRDYLTRDVISFVERSQYCRRYVPVGVPFGVDRSTEVHQENMSV